MKKTALYHWTAYRTRREARRVPRHLNHRDHQVVECLLTQRKGTPGTGGGTRFAYEGALAPRWPSLWGESAGRLFDHAGLLPASRPSWSFV